MTNHPIYLPQRRLTWSIVIPAVLFYLAFRYYPVGRMLLNRTSETVKTRFGAVRIKLVEQPDGTKQATPEYDDLKRIASARKIPLKLVHDEVMRNFTK